METGEDDTIPIPGVDPETRRGPVGGGRPPAVTRIEAAGLTHPGLVRPANEDHFLVARMERAMRTLASSLPPDEMPWRLSETGTVLMVADGMGGAAAGEVASRTAIRALVSLILEVPDWVLRADEASAEKLMKRSEGYYRAVHQQLRATARGNPALEGMGTTMTVGYVFDGTLFLGHVGDSRAYLHRRGELRQLTRDHTHVQRLVDRGVLSREEAATHRLRHLLTNTLGGVSNRGDVDLDRIDLEDGDRLLLCTDGLTGVLGDGPIAEVLGGHGDPEPACRSLLEATLERGAPDNVTVVVARCSIAADEADS